MKKTVAKVISVCIILTMLISQLSMLSSALRPVEAYPVITAGETKAVNIENGGDYYYFSFTPETDGAYVFSSKSENDTYGYLYDANLNELTSDDNGAENGNFSITYQLEAGKKYILGCCFYDYTVTGSFEVSLIEISVSSITAVATEVLIENYDGYNNGDYFCYDILKCNPRYTVTLNDGMVYIGEAWEIEDAFGYHPDIDIEQSAEKPLAVGKHTAEVSILGVKGTCEIEIVESPHQLLSYSYILLDDSNIIITEVHNPAETLTIPEKIDGYTVVGVSKLGYEATSVQKIILTDSVTSIGEYAFSGCTSLTSIIIPDSVTSIGYWAFDGCDNLKIYGNSGSYAETYAKENSIPFVVTGMSAPRLSKIANTAKGVTISWSKVGIAKSYNVYRKAGNATSWTRIASVTGTSYTDSKVSSGTKYTYTVRAVNGSDMSGFDAKGISILRLAQPAFKVDNQNGYVRVAWNKVAGATGYYVYRKAPNSKSWTRIATVSGTAYADKSVKSGSNYVYTVRAFNGNVSSSYHSGVAIKYLARPTFKVDNQNGYVRIAWNKVAGATGYYVYRKAPNAKSWTRIATVTGTAYNDKNVKSGSNYVYTVRAFNGKFTSTFHSGLAIKYLARPTFKVANKSNNVTVAWSNVAGAKGYYVSRRRS